MAGRVDEIDLVVGPVIVVPMDRGGGAGDGDSAFALQVHVVHGGASLTLDLLDAVDAAGIEQNALAQGGFTRVDVGRNANVSQIR